MKKYFALLIFMPFLSFSQNEFKNYQLFIKQADSLYKVKDYKNSALMYNKAFASIGGKDTPNDRYNVACSWALANYNDSAFASINKLIKKYNYSELKHINEDADFDKLHSDPRWPEVIKLIKENLDKIEAKYNRRLMSVIDSMKTEDQKWRELTRKLWNNEIDSLKFPKKFVQYNYRLTDSLNYFICKKIVEQ